MKRKFAQLVMIVMLLSVNLSALNYATKQIGVRNRVFPLGIKGDPNMSIVIIDTGIDLNHRGFAPVNPTEGSVVWGNNKTIAWMDFDSYDHTPQDESHHGTHTSYIAAGKPYTLYDQAQSRALVTASWSSSYAEVGQYPEASGFIIETPGEIKLDATADGGGFDSLFLMYAPKVASHVSFAKGEIASFHYDGFEGIYGSESQRYDSGSKAWSVLVGWKPVAVLTNVGAGAWKTMTYNVTKEKLGVYCLASVRKEGGVKFRVRAWIPTTVDPATGNLADGEKLFTGVSPDSKITMMKAVTPTQWDQAFSWVNTNYNKLQTAVISISQNANQANGSLVSSLYQKGVLTVVAAGNSSPIINGDRNTVGNPGRYPESITVGMMNAVDMLHALTSVGGADATESNGHMKPDLTAPGGGYTLNGGIWSADNWGDSTTYSGYICGNFGNPGSQGNWGKDFTKHDFVSFAGSSMATPIVAGSINLVIDALGGWTYWADGTDRRAKAAKVKQLLFMTATETGLGRENTKGWCSILQRGYDPAVADPKTVYYGKDKYEGYGRINVDAAINAATKSSLDYNKLDESDSLWSSRSAFINGISEQYPTTGTPLSDIDVWVSSKPHAWARKISLSQGATYEIKLTMDSNADFDLYLYKPTPTFNGDPLIAARSVSDVKGNTETISYTAAESGEYYLIVKAVDGKGKFRVTNVSTDINSGVKNYNFNIAQNYPNPFNPSTTIFYSLKEGFDGNVKVIVYNSFGQIVKTLVNEKQKEGNYKVIFNADNFPSGVYYYGIEAGNYISKKKMTLVK